jgi:23S rRNA pseudouridine1911/1915/1917 synthase
MLHELTVPASAAGGRLDVWLEASLEGCTRSLISRLIKQGCCALTDDRGAHAAKAGYFLRGGERVALEVPELEPMEAVAEDIPITILHEDEHIIVIDKPPGMVVHPAIGHLRGTLVNALLGRFGQTLPDPAGGEPVAWRPGIVHRLDEETSGLIVVARTPQALTFLQNAFKAREVHKRYLALVAGRPRADFFEHAGWIGRHVRDFRKRAVHPAGSPGAKEAYTSFVVLDRREGYAAVECRPRTGRTHQIRVHLAALGHAVLADHTYGRSRRWPLEAAADDTTALHRQALHAWAIDIPHPAGGRRRFSAPIPADMLRFLPSGLVPRGW